MIDIRREEDQVAIRFGYSEKFQMLVDVCRLLEGRYHSTDKHWTFPLIKLPALVKNFKTVEQVRLDTYCAQYIRDSLPKVGNQAGQELANLGDSVLMSHQRDGINYLLAGGRLIFDVFGTGKTRTLASSLLIMIKTNQLDSFMLLAPKSVLPAWRDEMKLVMAELGVDYPLVFVKDTKQFNKLLVRIQDDQEKGLTSPFGVFLTPDLFKRNVEATDALFKNRKWALAYDEMHGISNPTSLIGISVKEVSPQFKFGLTATPIPKNVENCWNLIDWAYPGYLGDYYPFCNRYVVYQTKEIRVKGGTRKIKEKVGYKNLPELQQKIAEVSLKRLREDVLDLPPFTFSQRYVEMTKPQTKIYNAVRDLLYHELKGLSKAEIFNALVKNPLVKTIRLLQAANDPSLIGEEASEIKLDALAELLEEADGPVIAWTCWHSQIDKMRQRFKGDMVWIDGRCSQDERERALNAFKTGQIKLFGGNPAAAGAGTTMVAANVAAYLDRSYSAVHRVQSLNRNYRIGQTRAVSYVDFISVKPGYDPDKPLIGTTIDSLTLKVINANISTMDAVIQRSTGDLATVFSQFKLEDFLS